MLYRKAKYAVHTFIEDFYELSTPFDKQTVAQRFTSNTTHR